MPDLVILPTSTSPQSQPNDLTANPGEEWQKYNPLHRAVADYLNIDINTEWSHAKPKIDYLIDWAKQKTGSDEPNQIVLTIHDLYKQLGPHSFGDRKDAYIYRHLKLSEKPQTKLVSKPVKVVSKQSKENPLTKTLTGALTNMINKEVGNVQKQVQGSIQQSLREAFKQIGNWKDKIR